MKFAVINDMHVGPADTGFKDNIQRKLVKQSEKLIKEFVEKMNSDENPEFVVNLGDSIEDVNDKKVDLRALKKAIALLSPLKMPLHFMVGNHDVKSISQAEVAALLGYKRMYYSFDHGKYHFVALSFERTLNPKTKKWGDASIPKEQLRWLKNDLSNTRKPTVVFSHYGLADDDMAGNFWFEKIPQSALIENRAEVRKIFEDSRKVKAVISAHQHWNRMFVHNGIPYFTVTSLVENFNNDGIASEAHTIVDITKRTIVVDVKGKDSAKFIHKFKLSPLSSLVAYFR